ncbi:MAG: MFS transporter [Lachnospiraceae bacterium]|nr:MFS transporter [Lachnospiraceae bacterium]
MKSGVNIKYMFIQGFFWMSYCIATGFVSLYLLGDGATNVEIGIVTALFGAISAIAQPVLGRICDKSEKVSWKNMMLVCVFIELILCICMCFISGRLFSCIFIGSLILVANLCMPFVNSSLFYYKSNDININFGIARGIGSGSYALLALIIGNLVVIYGTKTVPAVGILITIGFILVILMMPYDARLDNSSLNASDNSNKKSIKDFVKKYPSFFTMLVGFIFLATTHNIVMTYLLQIIQSVGGNSEHLGVTIAIQAGVEIPVLFLSGFFIKKYSAKSLMVFAAFGYVIKAALFYAAGSVISIYFVGLAQMISFAIFASASVYYTGETVYEEDRTVGQSLMTSVVAIGTVLGNLIGGLLLDMYGIRNMLLTNTIIGIIGLVIVLLSLKVKQSELEK